MLDTIFDKIYVVWGRDPDRKEYIQDHFSDRDIENYKFIRSITPRDLKIKKRTIIQNRLFGLFKKIGLSGLYRSIKQSQILILFFF